MKDGAPQATIVVPVTRGDVLAKAAGELQKYVEKMSGVKIPIQDSNIPVTGNIIRLGTGAVDAIKPTFEEIGVDGFIIKTTEGKVIIASCCEEGVLYGVYDLLEKLGCRFYMPMEIGEVVPKNNIVVIPPINLTSKPRLVYRCLWGCPAPDGWGDWAKKVGLGGPAMETQHIYDYVVPAEKYFAAHPEYFIEITEPGTGKKRRLSTGQRCISNPAVIKLFVDYSNAFLDKNPGALSCSLSINDLGDSSCQCDTCKSWDGPNENSGNRYLRFANLVAEEVAKKHPHKFVAYLSQYLCDIAVPEGGRARANLIPIVVNTSYFPHAITDNNPWSNNFRANCEKWPKIAKQIGIYDWFSPFRSSTHNIAGPDMEYYLKLPVIGYVGEITDWWFPNNISLYLTARMMWNAKFDYQHALEEFYDRFYGPASGPMKKYYDTMAQGARDFLKTLQPGTFKPIGTYMQETSDVLPGMHFNSPELRNKLTELLKKSEKLATDEPYRSRVRMTSQAQEAMNGYVEALVLFVAWKKDPSKELAKQTQESIRSALERLRSIQSINVMTTLPYVRELKDMKARIENDAVGMPASSFTSAQTVSGWDDTATFGDLWSQHQEIFSLPTDWKFKEDPKDEGVKGKWFLAGCNDQDWRNIKIREFWDPQLDKKYEGYAWYRINFKAPENMGHKKIYLAFGAVDESAWVYLNGKEAGVHDEGLDGWDKRFLIEVTSLLEPGKENLLAVRVLNLKQAGGIWKTVKLVTAK